MKTFQNCGEGFDVGEELGSRFVFISDVADQSAELNNRRHMRRDVMDDEIVNFFRLKKRTKIIVETEREEELHNSIRGFSVDDEILLGDEKVANSSTVVLLASWKRIDGGFELRRSGSGGEVL